jgi:hypothetical protein
MNPSVRNTRHDNEVLGRRRSMWVNRSDQTRFLVRGCSQECKARRLMMGKVYRRLFLRSLWRIPRTAGMVMVEGQEPRDDDIE